MGVRNGGEIDHQYVGLGRMRDVLERKEETAEVAALLVLPRPAGGEVDTDQRVVLAEQPQIGRAHV